MAAIVFQNVTKSYPRAAGQRWLRSILRPGKKTDHGRFEALRDVTFSIEQGESVALLGRNGAGKSTVLSLIAGLLPYDRGTVRVEGRVSAMLDLGAGFHPDLTGRENLQVNAALLGLTRRECRTRLGEMIEFSGLGNFVDEPLRTYSSGMWLRLSFAVATSVDPQILLIDEVLAVGDTAFQTRCAERIRELKEAGSIFVCASHSAEVERYCDKAIWLDQGRVNMTGRIDRVRASYELAAKGNYSIAESLPEAEVGVRPATRIRNARV